MRLNNSLYLFLNNLLNLLPGVGRANTLRGWLAGMALQHCGRKLQISSGVNIFDAKKVTVGDNVYIGCNCYFGGGTIVLEDEVSIGPGVTLAAGKHTMLRGSYRFGPYDYGHIHVGRGTWLCATRSLPPASPLAGGAWSRGEAWSSRTFLITAWYAACRQN